MEKKHEPSEKRWSDAAEKGELPKSADLSSGVVLVAGAAALLLGADFMRRAIEALWVDLYAASGPPVLERADAVALGAQAAQAAGLALALPLGAVILAAVAVNLAQTRAQLAPKALEPKWERLDPFGGFKNLYLSWQPLVELAKGLTKLLLLGAVAWAALRGPGRILPLLAAAEPADQVRVIGELSQRLITASAVLIAAIAAGDYAWTWYRKHQELMLTDRELRDESKERDGDPQRRARQRQRARQIAMGSMLAAVRTADVVVTNPTHYAVALKYDREAHVAPVVVAKGADELALKLRAEARRAGVPRIENRPLARGLYAEVRVGHPIPERWYGPVARVLAVVYARRRR
jgi:flagellar biosynthetic protein FlhB